MCLLLLLLLLAMQVVSEFPAILLVRCCLMHYTELYTRDLWL